MYLSQFTGTVLPTPTPLPLPTSTPTPLPLSYLPSHLSYCPYCPTVTGHRDIPIHPPAAAYHPSTSTPTTALSIHLAIVCHFTFNSIMASPYHLLIYVAYHHLLTLSRTVDYSICLINHFLVRIITNFSLFK